MGDIKKSKNQCQQFMYDYHQIRSNKSERKLTPDETAEVFEDSKRWLETTLRDLKGQTNVVITHHAPSMKSVLPKYQKELVTAAFASELEGFIEEHKPTYWIHGHVHNQVDYLVGDTRVLCNPRGYPNAPSRMLFNPVANFELK